MTDINMIIDGAIVGVMGGLLTSVVPHKWLYVKAAWARLVQWYFCWAMSSLKAAKQSASPAFREAFWGYHKWQSKERCLMEEIHDGHSPR